MAWLSGWSKRIKITIDETNVDSDQDWLPVTVFLGTSVGQTPSDVSSIFDEVGAESKKIAVTEDDGETELYVEIEEWDDSGETAVLHISKDGWTVTAASATEIYIYYDSTHADNDTYVGVIGSRTEVWDSNFMMVQHMVDTTTSTITDSTGNGNDGTKLAANQPIEANGKIYKGQDFDGDNDKIGVGTGAHVDNLTFEAWAKTDEVPLTESKMICSDNDEVDLGWQIFALNATKKLRLRVDTDGGNTNVDTGDVLLSDTTLYHVVGWYDGTTLKIYVNTGEEATGDHGNPGNIKNTGNTRYIGSSTGAFWNGVIDESRISSIARTVAWIKATYYSTKDDLLGFGSEEQAPTGALERRRKSGRHYFSRIRRY